MLLKVNNLTGGYRKKTIVNDISFSLNIGDILCILGPNGCGKSTLLKMLLRLIPLKKGEIFIDDMNLYEISRKHLAKLLSYIPQNDSILFPYTAVEVISMGKTPQLNSFHGPTKEDLEEAYKILEKLNILHLANKPFTKLSGGERQLILIGRAINQDAKIFIMDEPTSSLDYKNQQVVLKIIRKLSKRNKTIIFTTHSPQEPFNISTKVLLMSQGKLVKFGKPNEVLLKESLESVFDIPLDIVTIKDNNNNLKRIII